MSSEISLITCVNQLDFIGEKGGLLYRISADLFFLKKTTMNSVVIMGYKTYAEIGKALPLRENIVVFNKQKGTPSFAENIHAEPSYDSAIEWAKKHHPSKPIFVIGGEMLYKEAFRKGVDYIYLTYVHDNKIGDTSFIPRNEILKDFHIYNTETWNHHFKDKKTIHTEHPTEYSFQIFRHNKHLKHVDEMIDVITMMKNSNV